VFFVFFVFLVIFVAAAVGPSYVDSE